MSATYTQALFYLSSHSGPLQQSSILYIEFHIQNGPLLLAGISPIRIMLNGVSSCRLNEDSGGHIVRASYEAGALLIERNESCRVPPGGSLADRDEVDGLLWSAVVCFKSSSD